jgi:hypothetical protein
MGRGLFGRTFAFRIRMVGFAGIIELVMKKHALVPCLWIVYFILTNLQNGFRKDICCWINSLRLNYRRRAWFTPVKDTWKR